MTNPFERGSSGPNPFGQGMPGAGTAGTNPAGTPASTRQSPGQGAAAPSRPGAAPVPGSSGPGIGDNAADWQDLDGRLRELRKASDGMRAAKERLSTLAGTGTAADGKVRVTWAAATGLDELHLDPRAMRMPSQDLAAAIKSAVTEAMADLRRQTAEVLRAETGVSAGGSVAKIHQMREAFDEQMDEITARIDEARRRMERALLR